MSLFISPQISSILKVPYPYLEASFSEPTEQLERSESLQGRTYELLRNSGA